MRPAHVIDVSRLPDYAYGPRAPLFWGVLCLVAIESTMFAILGASYLYVRGNYLSWPPTLMPRPPFVAATIGLGFMLLSILPTHLQNRAAIGHRLRGMQVNVTLATLCGLAFLATRVYELKHLPFQWDSHAYGSIFWTMLGLHTMHGIASLTENLVFLALLLKGPVEEKHTLDLQVNGVYWYFVAGSLVPIWALLYLDPLLFRR